MIGPRTPGRIAATVAALFPLFSDMQPVRAQQTESLSFSRSDFEGKFKYLIGQIDFYKEILHVGSVLSKSELSVYGLSQMCERLGQVWHFLCREKTTPETPTKVLSVSTLNLLINNRNPYS